MTETIQIKVGKFYQRRDGVIVGLVTQADNHKLFPFRAGNFTYTLLGAFCATGEDSIDLIEEAPDLVVPINEKSRVAGRFISNVLRKLQKAHNKKDIIPETRIDQLTGKQVISLRDVAELALAAGYRAELTLHKINKRESPK